MLTLFYKPKTVLLGLYLYSLGIACAAVFLTYGDISEAASLMANIIIGTMIVTLMLERTRRALALISWFGSWRSTKWWKNTLLEVVKCCILFIAK